MEYAHEILASLFDFELSSTQNAAAQLFWNQVSCLRFSATVSFCNIATGGPRPAPSHFVNNEEKWHFQVPPFHPLLSISDLLRVLLHIVTDQINEVLITLSFLPSQNHCKPGRRHRHSNR